MFSEASFRLLPAGRHQQLVRPGDADKTRIAAARRGVDAAVGAHCSTQKRRHRITFRMRSISGRAFAITARTFGNLLESLAAGRQGRLP